jgi:hypothetical protein
MSNGIPRVQRRRDEAGRCERGRRQGDGARKERGQMDAQLRVEQPDHDPDRGIELVCRERRVEIAEVVVHRQHDRGGRRNPGQAQHTLVTLIATHDMDALELVGVDDLVAGSCDQRDHFVAQTELLDGPQVEMIQAADDDVSGRDLCRRPGARVTGDSGGIGRGWLSHGRECTGGATWAGRATVIRRTTLPRRATCANCRTLSKLQHDHAASRVPHRSSRGRNRHRGPPARRGRHAAGQRARRALFIRHHG